MHHARFSLPAFSISEIADARMRIPIWQKHPVLTFREWVRIKTIHDGHHRIKEKTKHYAE
jgi:hypothetical protein